MSAIYRCAAFFSKAEHCIECAGPNFSAVLFIPNNATMNSLRQITADVW